MKEQEPLNMPYRAQDEEFIETLEEIAEELEEGVINQTKTAALRNIRNMIEDERKGLLPQKP